MAKVKVNFDIKKTQIIDKRTAEIMGAFTVVEMKKMIRNGISPVKGLGRFDGYAATRSSASARKLRKNLKSKKARSAAASLIKAREKNKYPYSVKDKFPSKKIRPVNLVLDGTYLKHLTYWIGSKSSVTQRLYNFSRRLGFVRNEVVSIGLSAGRGRYKRPKKKILDMFETHNEGTQAPKVPQRRHLPTTPGEQFNVSIMRGLKKILQNRVEKLILMSNKKTNKRGR